ncbi:MAG: hypothetical protein ACJA2G_003502 [Cognaticolwellia sp.]|jgi:hypothetical protein
MQQANGLFKANKTSNLDDDGGILNTSYYRYHAKHQIEPNFHLICHYNVQIALVSLP